MPRSGAVSALLADLEAASAEWLDATVRAVEESIDQLAAEHGEPEQVTLAAYATDDALAVAHPDLPWPASWHRARLAEIRADLGHDRVGFAYGAAGR